MNVVELLKITKSKGIILYLENGKLAFKAPPGALTPDLKKQVVAKKSEIIELLQQREQANIVHIEAVKRRPDEHMVTSFAQQRLWLLDKIDGGGAHYNVCEALKLSGTLDVTAFKRAFGRIVERHEALRTVFAEDPQGQPVQIIRQAQGFEVSYSDLSALQGEALQAELARKVKAESEKLFDLSQDIMLRVQLLQLEQDQYVVLVTLHHIACDGWSMGIVLNEFSRLYQAFAQHQDDPFEPLQLQYADYAQWQRSYLKGAVLDKQMGYWSKQLSGLPAVHSLPLDKVRPAVQSYNGQAYQNIVPTAQLQVLSKQCQAQGATLFMGVHAAFSVLLARYSQQTDIVIGTPVANREQAEIAPLIGFFMNNLVLRINLSGTPSFSALLGRSKQMLLDAYAHQQVPFEQIVERLQPQRSLSHSPLFQVMLLQNAEQGEGFSLPGLTLGSVERQGIVAKYDLTLLMSQSSQGLVLNWDYNSDLFEAATIARMANHFSGLLAALISQPEQNVFSLNLIDDTERQQMLLEFNATDRPFSSDKCVHQLFQEQVAQTPDACAVVCVDGSLSYGELNQKANQLAHYLIEQHNIKPDTLVGICIDRSLPMMVGLLAILKAGGAYVPLDPEYPESRLAYMLDDAKLCCVLTLSHLLKRTPISPQQALCLDDSALMRQLDDYISDDIDSDAQPLRSNNLAYVIYTSGSTGRPKGVMVEHRQLCNLLESMKTQPGCQMQSRLLAVTSLSFDIHTLELFLPLITGAQLVVASTEQSASPQLLAELIERHQISMMQATPSTWKMLLDDHWRPAHQMNILCGGEALPNGLKNALVEFDQLTLWNMYGPTETCVWSATRQMDLDIPVTVGKPIANTQLYVLDGNLGPCPIGVIGELYIGGTGLTRGYINRDDLTQQAFVTNPFKAQGHGSERIYKTGDSARWLSDGNLVVLGRIDNQIKLHGFRIELGEIEHVLDSYESVNDVVVLVNQNAASEEALVAYLVTKDAEALNGDSPQAQEAQREFIGQLRQMAASQLPSYMVPGAYTLLGRFPLTPNGKVDRKALLEIDVKQLQAVYVAPTTDIEQYLCQVWQTLLHIENIGIEDNFFELGGHSLSATRLMAQLNQRYDMSLALQVIFNHQTIAELAAYLDAELLGKGGKVHDSLGAKMVINKAPAAASYPLSFSQQRLWLLDKIGGGSVHYNMPEALRLKGELQIDALEQAFAEIVQRHQVLRTVFAEDSEGQPVQVIRQKVDFKVKFIDLSDMAEDAKHQACNRYVEQAPLTLFNLQKDLKLRVELIKLAEQEHVITLTMHHIASDGWSMGILINEFSSLYASFVNGRDSDLPQPPLQYVDYAIWQRNWLQGEVLDQQLGYWEQALADLPVVHNLPLDRPRPAVQTFVGAIYESRFKLATAKRFKHFCQQQQATLYMGLHAAFSAFIARCSGETDIVLGSPIASREQPGVESMIGLFLNNLVLRSDLSGAPSFEALLQQSKQRLLDAYAHQQAPFEQIVERLQPERCPSHSPLFQVILVLHNVEESALSMPGLAVEQVLQEVTIAKYDLILNVSDSDQGLAMNWGYNSDLFDQQTIQRMAVHFERLVESWLDKPQLDVFKAPLLNQDEYTRHYVRWNDTKADYAADVTLDKQFERQVAHTPDAIAVELGDTKLSYSELNCKANRLANALDEAGVVQGECIGIYLPRSIEMLVALLGVMKIGAPFVPLDPEYPQERISLILKDAEVEQVLTLSDLMASLPMSGVEVFTLDGAASDDHWFDSFDGDSLESTEVTLTPQSLLYILYTSGSTGKPKGVMVPHQGVSNYLHHATTSYMKDEIDGSVVSSPLVFDATLTTLLTPLFCGKTVTLLPDDKSLLNVLANQLFAHSQPKLFKITPAHLEALSHMADNFGVNQTAHTIVVGGEQLLFETLKVYREKWLPNTTFINEYGPTETVVGCSTYTLEPLNDQAQSTSGAVPIGRPIGNIRLYVLSPALVAQPVTVSGELYIGGDGVTLGYLNRDKLNAECFVSHPDIDSGPLYRTGDLVRLLPDGELVFVGRVDDQVKIRGFRVELGEIEITLRGFDNIKEAVVIIRSDDPQEPGHKRLVAYVVANNEEQKIDTTTLGASCLDRLGQVLPEYMVPAFCLVIDEIPLTVNGKVNSRLLPSPDSDKLQKQSYVAPQNALQQSLCDVWQQVLKRTQVGIQDNFFRIGGDSILSIKIVSMLRAQGIELQIQDIFRFQSVESLAFYISESGGGKTAFKLVKPFELLTEQERELATEGFEDVYPMSALQAGMVFHTEKEGFNGVYHDINGEQVKYHWQQDAFEQALAACIKRHPILRTGYHLGDSRPLQQVYREMAVPLVVEDISHLEPQAQTEYISQWITERQQHVFDWAAGGLFQVNVFLRAQAHFEFVLSFHHSILDGWSRASLTTELYHYYEQLLKGQTLGTVEPEWIYRQFIAAELAVLEDDKAREYFISLLENAPTEQLPRNTIAADVQRSHAIVPVAAVSELSEKIIDLAGQLSVPVQALLLTAHFKVLSAMSGHSQVMTCMVSNGRPEMEGAEQGVGLFLNSLPLSMNLRALSWRALIADVAQLMTESMAYRHYPIMKIQHDVESEFSEVLFNYTHFHVFSDIDGDGGASRGEDDGLEVVASTGVEYTNFDFTVDFSRSVDGQLLSMYLTYDTALYDASLVERIGGYYHDILEAMVCSLDSCNMQFSLLSGTEQQLMQQWNDTARDIPRDQCLHQLFEQQAEQSPTLTALWFGDTSLSYRQLNEQANRLAHYLRSQRSIVPDTMVGICLDRSVNMIVAMLAILKAGGAYVPLDPEFPQERIRYMIDDAKMNTVITVQTIATKLDGFGDAAMVLDDSAVDSALQQQPTDNIDLSGILEPQHLAYVIYTSGSTGKPKGVMVPQQSVVNFLTAMQVLQISNEDKLLAVTSISFDIHVLELFLPLVNGATLVLASKAMTLDPGMLINTLSERSVNMMQATPATWKMLLDARWQPAQAITVLCGGEALSRQLADALTAEPKITLWNMYGPTETTVWSSCHQIKPGDKRIVVGKPIANTQLYVVSDTLQQVPIGVSGELLIGGEGLTRGYHNRDQLTELQFIDNPFYQETSVDNSKKLYCTGDLARRLPDGTVEVLGRIDDQVKIRGFRVELGEIETQLGQHPMVKEAVVVTSTSASGEQQLVGYVVPGVSNDSDLDGTEVANSEADEHQQLKISLFYFGGANYQNDNKYDLYLKAAKYADRNGLYAVWTPERHFDAVGGLYPNPALLNAALATATDNIQLRAGSVVSPLHESIRISEEWSVVDNLSNGRAGVAIASGWHQRDFVFAPDNFENRKEVVNKSIDEIRTLWSGGKVSRIDGLGATVEVEIFPKPIQSELPIWLTAAGNPNTFIEAGRQGTNLLTHLLGQTIDKVAENVALYRQALADNGYDPKAFTVTLMIHTFLGDDKQATIERAKAPFMEYMKGHIGLLLPVLESLGMETSNVSDEDLNMVAAIAFERYVQISSLIGTPQSSLAMVNKIKQADIDEMSCLIDWMQPEAAFEGLAGISKLRKLSLLPELDTSTLQNYCGASLPGYMVPSVFVMLDEMPLTPNGKIDRRALPAIDNMATQQDYVAPSTEIEEKMCEIWQTLLAVERVSVYDNFFQLGGNSLGFIGLQFQIKEIFKLNISMNILFEKTNVKEQSELIEGKLLMTQQPILVVGTKLVEEEF